MADFIRGRDTKFRVYFNNQPFNLFVKTWSIEEVAVEAEDGVNGEDRDRLMKITKYYRCTFDCYDDGSSQILQNLIQNQANDDAFSPQLQLAGGALFTYRDTTRAAFVLAGASMGPLKMSSAGRTDAFAHSLTFRAQYFRQVNAA